MKRMIAFVLLALVCLSFTACTSFGKQSTDEDTTLVPESMRMKSICELATMQCYYHNVAKYYEADASGTLWWKKDRHFWIEYSGVVTIGIDTSLMHIEVEGENVTITLPSAQVLSCKVDENTLNENSFIVATDSAKVEAEHQRKAFEEAQEKMRQAASSDTALLINAQLRAQKLLEDYVNNIGNCTGVSYKITWLFSDDATQQENTD